MTYLLAIETSGKFGSVAFASKNVESLDFFYSVDLPRTVGSAQSLALSIQQLSHSSGVSLREVGCIALVNGPGSFTGLRVGIATAKSLAYALNIPVLGLDTLEVIHLQAADTDLSTNHSKSLKMPNTYALIDAYRGQLFVRMKDSHGNQSESRVQDILEFLEGCRLKDPASECHFMIGPGVDRVKRFIDREIEDKSLEHWCQGMVLTESQMFEPQAKFVAKLGLERWSQGQEIAPIELLPNYFRGSAAEEKAKAV